MALFVGSIVQARWAVEEDPSLLTLGLLLVLLLFVSVNIGSFFLARRYGPPMDNSHGSTDRELALLDMLSQKTPTSVATGSTRLSGGRLTYYVAAFLAYRALQGSPDTLIFWGRMIAAIALVGSSIAVNRRLLPDSNVARLAKSWLTQVLPHSNAEIVHDPKMKSLMDELRQKKAGCAVAVAG